MGIAHELLKEQGIFRLRVETAKDLLDEGARMLDETGRTELRDARLLLAVQCARAVHIFESVIALCDIGRGVQASMLNRALLEDALDVHWVAANPDLASAQADEHEEFLVLGERSLEAKHGRPGKPLTEQEQVRLKQLHGQFGGFSRSWTKASVPDRIALVKSSWDAEASDYLSFVYDVVQRQNNMLLHPSPLAYGLAMTRGRQMINRVGPDERWRDAVAHGCLGFYLVLRIIAREFDLDRGRAEDLIERAGRLSTPFATEELATVADGMRCPCGTGDPVERCHRS